MSDSTQSSDDENGNDTQRDLTRRAVLHGAAGTTVLALAAGGVAANGKGGQAFVHVDDFDADGTFEIEEGPFEAPEDRRRFSCGNQGPGLSFPYWEFTYEGEDTVRRIYTRDNTIDTDATYRWTNDKECSEDYRQAGFTSVN